MDMFNGEYLLPEEISITDQDLPLTWVDYGKDIFPRQFQKIADWWLQQDSIVDLIDKASKIPSEVRTVDSFAGSFFEQAAFLQLQVTTRDPNKILFSPDQTFSLFSKANSDRDSDILDGFSPAIQGLTYPDFIAFYINRHSIVITDIFECKMGRSIRPNQIAAYAKEDFLKDALKLKRDTVVETNNTAIFLGAIMHEIVPEIPILPVRISDKIHKTLVVPFDSKLELPGFKPYHIDINRRKFGVFMELLWSDITKSEPFNFFSTHPADLLG